jgi:hypothetical protein
VAKPGRLILWFGIAGLFAPIIRGIFLLWPNLYPFKALGTADRVFELGITALWPMSIPVAMAIDVGGARAIGAFLFGLVTNVILYVLIGAIAYQAVIVRKLQR